MEELQNTFDEMIAYLNINLRTQPRKAVIETIKKFNDKYADSLGIFCFKPENITKMYGFVPVEYTRSIDEFLLIVIDNIEQYARMNGQLASFRRDLLMAKVDIIRNLTGWAKRNVVK